MNYLTGCVAPSNPTPGEHHRTEHTGQGHTPCRETRNLPVATAGSNHRFKGVSIMTEHDAGDLEALHGQYAEVEQVHVTEDADGIPSWIKVEREHMHVVIVPSLLVPRAAPTAPPGAHTPAAPAHVRRADQTDDQDETCTDALHRQGVAP